MNTKKQDAVSKQSLGGTACGKLQRASAIKSYNDNPNICEFCLKPIPVGDYKVAYVRTKRFCDRTCSGSRKLGTRKFKTPRVENPTRIVICVKCGESFKVSKNSRRKICTECKPQQLSTITKGELFSSRSSWQSARSSIRHHAARICKDSTCRICGYSMYTEVAHIRPVSDFPDSALIKEINHPNNLVALCPNHHKELDLGFIKPDELHNLKIVKRKHDYDPLNLRF